MAVYEIELDKIMNTIAKNKNGEYEVIDDGEISDVFSWNGLKFHYNTNDEILVLGKIPFIVANRVYNRMTVEERETVSYGRDSNPCNVATCEKLENKKNSGISKQMIDIQRRDLINNEPETMYVIDCAIESKEALIDYLVELACYYKEREPSISKLEGTIKERVSALMQNDISFESIMESSGLKKASSKFTNDDNELVDKYSWNGLEFYRLNNCEYIVKGDIPYDSVKKTYEAYPETLINTAYYSNGELFRSSLNPFFVAHNDLFLSLEDTYDKNDFDKAREWIIKQEYDSIHIDECRIESEETLAVLLVELSDYYKKHNTSILEFVPDSKKENLTYKDTVTLNEVASMIKNRYIDETLKSMSLSETTEEVLNRKNIQITTDELLVRTDKDEKLNNLIKTFDEIVNPFMNPDSDVLSAENYADKIVVEFIGENEISCIQVSNSNLEDSLNQIPSTHKAVKEGTVSYYEGKDKISYSMNLKGRNYKARISHSFDKDKPEKLFIDISSPECIFNMYYSPTTMTGLTDEEIEESKTSYKNEDPNRFVIYKVPTAEPHSLTDEQKDIMIELLTSFISIGREITENHMCTSHDSTKVKSKNKETV